jgi:MFS transporter, NNP family, nitrate/nitrite transporter
VSEPRKIGIAEFSDTKPVYMLSERPSPALARIALLSPSQLKICHMVRLWDLKRSGHLPTLISAFLYFDFSFMIWTVLGPLGAQVGETLHLSPDQKGLMVAVPILSGVFLRILLGLLVNRIGSKRTGLIAQAIVICGLFSAWIAGLPSLTATILLGLVLGFAGASFAVALPRAGRWYPPSMQGVVMGVAGAGNIGVVLDSLFAPRLAQTYGWQAVFGLALILAVLVLLIYLFFATEPPNTGQKRQLSDYLNLLKTSMRIGSASTTP